MKSTRLTTTTVIEDVSQDQVCPSHNTDEFTDAMMDVSSQWSEAAERIGELDDVQIIPEDLGVAISPTIVLSGDVVACFVLEATSNKLYSAVAQAIITHRSSLVVFFSMVPIEETLKSGMHPVIKNISVGLNALPLSSQGSKILLPSQPVSRVDPVESYSIRDFWGKGSTQENIQQILERGIQRRKDLTSRN
ncbi:hypothetical protein CL635_03030 [bacterium]|nr:hypothetical protein [bacterium]|tara:strand:- start:17309 stop:17884 length:576 start_codon:yes stop_codon:yes gene_type:complete